MESDWQVLLQAVPECVARVSVMAVLAAESLEMFVMALLAAAMAVMAVLAAVMAVLERLMFVVVAVFAVVWEWHCPGGPQVQRRVPWQWIFLCEHIRRTPCKSDDAEADL